MTALNRFYRSTQYSFECCASSRASMRRNNIVLDVGHTPGVCSIIVFVHNVVSFLVRILRRSETELTHFLPA